jgi:hypothetical protein
MLAASIPLITPRTSVIAGREHVALGDDLPHEVAACNADPFPVTSPAACCEK